jgi:hypothetical protein
MQAVIDQIVQEFLAGIAELDGARERLFLNWLSSHSGLVDCVGLDEPAVCLQEALPRWLGTLDAACLLWEYRLVLHEIEWCAELKMDELERFLREQA